MLNMEVRTLRRHCLKGEIRFVLTGKRTRQFTPADIDEFIKKRTAECPSESPQAQRVGTTISRSTVYDFMALREQRLKARPGKSRRG